MCSQRISVLLELEFDSLCYLQLPAMQNGTICLIPIVNLVAARLSRCYKGRLVIVFCINYFNLRLELCSGHYAYPVAFNIWCAVPFDCKGLRCRH